MHPSAWIETETVIEMKRNGECVAATVDVRIGYIRPITAREAQEVTALQVFLLRSVEGKRALRDLAQEEFNRPAEQRRMVDSWPAITRHLTAQFEQPIFGKRYPVFMMMRS